MAVIVAAAPQSLLVNMARGVRIGAKSDVVATLRSLLRAARSRSPAKSVRQSAFAQEILSQVPIYHLGYSH